MPTILDMQIGQIGYIQDFTDRLNACKLLSLGLLPKSQVRILRYAPLGDALYLKIDHQLVAVRVEEAKSITVEIQE